MSRFVTRNGDMGQHFVDKARAEQAATAAAHEEKAQKFLLFTNECLEGWTAAPNHRGSPIVDSAFEAIMTSYLAEVRDL